MPYQVSTINPAKTALIIVDMENDFVAESAPLRVVDGDLVRCFGNKGHVDLLC